MNMTRDDLVKIQNWAEEKIQGGSEPPWAWYQYMKLIEAVESLVKGIDSTIVTTECLQQSDTLAGKVVSLRVSSGKPKKPQHRTETVEVPLPM